MTTVRYITNSELRTFKRCEREWWFTQHRGLRPIQPEVAGPREVGTMVHEALRAYYDPTTGDVDPINVVRAIAQENVKRANELKDQEAIKGAYDDGELAELMVQGYLEWLAETGADEDLDVIAPEQQLEAPLMEVGGVEYRLLAKLDLRVQRRSDGLRFFLDHKTVGNLTDLPKLAYMNEQLLHYALIAKLTDPANPVNGAMFNMLRKVKRTSRAKPPFFGRHDERFNDEYLRSYWKRVVRTVNQMVETERALGTYEGDPLEAARSVAIPFPQQFCNWGCDFKPICPMYDDGSDPEGLVPRLYETGDPLARYAAEEERA